MDRAASLEVTTPNDREIAMTRVFDASRALVFLAWTTPALLKRWFHGPDGWLLTECEIDLRVGGAYRYVWRGAGGRSMGVSGVYREVAAPERLVNTEQFDEAWYAGEALVTTVLAEAGDKTRLTSTMRFVSQEARDTALRSGMEHGVADSYDRLAALLPTLAQGAR